MRNVAQISIKNNAGLLGLNHLTTIDYRPTTNCFYICREGSTNQPLFMRNKPNLLNTQISVTSIFTKDYENAYLREHHENKPNQSQSCRGVASGEAGTNPIKANQTQFPSVKQEKFQTILRIYVIVLCQKYLYNTVEIKNILYKIPVV